ncbi:MAG: anaerobic glycerol-3-phosphate dehydrogenase subunit C, partial [Planctomycetales bacterium]|nr:anaerobic glycerol-3-phosphate dehydrogenase subunit C [Planctomycetales bacterium]
LAAGALLAIDPYDQQVVWELATEAGPRLYQLQGAARPAPLFEDIAVAPAALPGFLQQALVTLQRNQVTASVFAHAGSGQIHLRPFVDIGDVAQMEKIDDVATEIYEQVWALGGTISASEGEGLSRTPYIERQLGQRMEAYRELKGLFDPRGSLNPGKKLPRTDGVAVERLRPVAYPQTDVQASGGTTPRSFELHLEWRADEMAHAARTCNGCAACRTQAPETRMCPIFRYSPREEATPRAKANLTRAILTGCLPDDAVLEETCKQVADLCVHCHMCRIECPSSVDVPKLMMEIKAGYAATNGLSVQDRLLVNVDRLCSLASRFPRVANWIIRNRPARWVLEKTCGIAQGRKLPRISYQPFLQSNEQRRRATALAPPKDSDEATSRALYFVDTYANYCDTQLARALIAVLEHNGVSTYIPAAQGEAGMPKIAHGMIDQARRLAERNVSLLAEGVRRGYDVVATEPSAALALKREYLHLLNNDPDADLVANHTYDACRYLWTLHRRGKLKLDFQPLDFAVGYHAPCHSKALGDDEATVNLLNLIPGLDVRPLDKGCSGIAGVYGFKRSSYRRSLRVGLPLIAEMRSGRFLAGATDCSTCRVQMEQGAAKPTIHPVKLLALAYGLMPEIERQLHRTNEQLIVR